MSEKKISHNNHQDASEKKTSISVKKIARELNISMHKLLGKRTIFFIESTLCKVNLRFKKKIIIQFSHKQTEVFFCKANSV